MLLNVCTSNAQDTIAVIIRPALDKSKLSKIDPATLEQIPQIPTNAPMENMKVNNPIVNKNSEYIIRFRDLKTKGLLQIGQLDAAMTVEVIVNSKTYTRNISQGELKMTDLNINFSQLFNGDIIPDNSNIRIVVTTTNKNYEILNTELDTKYYNKIQHYQSLGQDLGGFWIPTLLYSTNFKSTSTGVPFATLPIGIAYGWKFYGKGVGYIGVSAMANWLIYSQPSSSSSTSTNSSFNLQGLTGGILIDFSDIISIGYAYGKNLESGGTDPGSMFVLGIGSKTLSFFKKDKSSQQTTPASPQTLDVQSMLE